MKVYVQYGHSIESPKRDGNLWHPQVTPGWKCPDCGTVVFE